MLVAPLVWLIGFGAFLERAAVGLGLLALALVTAGAGIGLLIYGLVAKRMKLTPKVRIAAGISLVVAGFLVGFAFLFQGGFINLYGAAAAWALTIGGLVVLLYLRWEAPIATGIALMLVAPLVWFASFLVQFPGLILVTFLPALIVALYGVILIVLGLAEKRREEVG